MSVGLVLLGFIILVGVVFLGAVVVSYASGDRTEIRSKVAEARALAAAARDREKVATQALRAIVNGAGNPVLEATIALDTIDQSYTKELN